MIISIFNHGVMIVIFCFLVTAVDIAFSSSMGSRGSSMELCAEFENSSRSWYEVENLKLSLFVLLL